jgi:membrane protease YdiL (CAAX protease family)
VGAALVALARRGGATWVELGLDRAAAPAGLRLGVKVAVVVGAAIGVGAALPSTRLLFADERYTGLSAAGLAYQALVRIPLGTVVLEELAFRGVLPALFARSMSVRQAVAASSALFGLWHILPALSAAAANDLFSGVAGRAALAAGAVGITTAAGVVFCGLRLRSGSVVAPMLAHTATNSLGLVAAFTVLRES